MEKSAFVENLFGQQHGNNRQLPSKPDSTRFIDDLRFFLFPEEPGLLKNKEELGVLMDRLRLDFTSPILPLQNQLIFSSEETTQRFFDSIPETYGALIKDAAAFIQSDPAATCPEEILLAYPGFRAIFVYRFAHSMYLLQIPLIPRIIAEYAHSSTGIDIHPGAEIGESFFIDHGTGVVIGETTKIGNKVKIYQGVTLGALSVEKSKANTKRHPTLEDNVIIYSGSTILGGDTVIGHDTVIGGNVWLTAGVPPYSVVYNKSESKVRNHGSFEEPVNFII